MTKDTDVDTRQILSQQMSEYWISTSRGRATSQIKPVFFVHAQTTNILQIEACSSVIQHNNVIAMYI